MLLPPGADDRLSDLRILMETVDAELPVKAKALLAYLTFTFPTTRLHEQYELVRDFTRRLIVDPFEVAALLVQHAPHRAGFGGVPHVCQSASKKDPLSASKRDPLRRAA